jgi:hypothetical protein
MAYTKVNNYRVPFAIYINSGNQIPQLYASGSNQAGGRVDGSYNPQWRRQIAQGSGATTACSGSNITINPGFLDFYGLIKRHIPPYDSFDCSVIGQPELIGLGTQNVAVPPSVVTEVTNRCIRKFVDRSDQARSSIEFGQDLGEWRETVHGLMNPLKSLREFTFSHLSKVLKLTKTVKHKAALSKMVADTWLEFKFGWFPLAADVGQAYADFTNKSKRQEVQPIYASAHGTFPIYDSSFPWYSNGLGQTYVRVLVTGTYSVRMKGAIRTGAKDGRIGTMQQLQLDLPHFVPTIWDLLPYSFIVDYFVNVGDIFRGLCYQFSNLAWGNKTVRTTHEYEYDWSWTMLNYAQNQFDVILKEDTASNPDVTYVDFVRTPLLPTDLIPEVRISLPLGSEKPWENMAALLLGRQKEISRVARHLR